MGNACCAETGDRKTYDPTTGIRGSVKANKRSMDLNPSVSSI